MLAGRLDLTIEQGATFSLSLSYQTADGRAVSLAGYTARMQLRTSYEAADPALTLTTENGRISLGTDGSIALTIPASITSTLTASGVYDLELVSGDVVTRLVQGTYSVSPEVTR